MRCFFDIFDGDHWTRDDVGMDCRDAHDAKYQAVLALTEMARDQLPSNGDRMTLSVRVRSRHEAFAVRLQFETLVEEPSSGT